MRAEALEVDVAGEPGMGAGGADFAMGERSKELRMGESES